jgi:hypothetical protein
MAPESTSTRDFRWFDARNSLLYVVLKRPQRRSFGTRVQTGLPGDFQNMADSRLRHSNVNTRQSFSTRVTGPTMHATRAGTAPLFADGTRFGATDVAKGSSINARRRGFAGGGGG